MCNSGNYLHHTVLSKTDKLSGSASLSYNYYEKMSTELLRIIYRQFSHLAMIEFPSSSSILTRAHCTSGRFFRKVRACQPFIRKYTPLVPLLFSSASIYYEILLNYRLAALYIDLTSHINRLNTTRSPLGELLRKER